MGKLKKLFMVLTLAAVSSVALVGCQKPEELKDGYQFGDGTEITLGVIHQVAEYRYQYCVEGSQTARVMLVHVVRQIWPDYPVDGICSDVDELGQALAKYRDEGEDKAASIAEEPDG